MTARAIAVAGALSLVMACASNDAGPSPTSPEDVDTTVSSAVEVGTPVLLDYSPTVSDIGALVFVAAHPDLRLVAVTLAGTGESYCDEGVAHTRGVLEMLGLGGVPVACGPEDPITGWNAFPTSWRVAASELDLPEASPNETRSAPELIADVVGGSDVPVEVLAVAPLTNLALAFESDPTLADLVGAVTVMGGAVGVPGNVIRNEVAEWNVWVDPTAAAIVLASGAPVTLVPLDATNHLPANEVFFDALDDAAATPAATLVRDLLAGDPLWLQGGSYFWDELAAAVLVDQSIVELDTRTLVVHDETRQTKGWTEEDPAGAEIRVAVAARRTAFEQLYLDTLLGHPGELGYITPTEDEVAYFAEVERITADADAVLEAVIAQAAAGLGLVEGAEWGERFFEVVIAALPDAIEGPWREQIEALDAMSPPSSVAESHEAWVAAMEAFVQAEEELVAALATSDWEAFEPLFAPVVAACTAVEEAAGIRLIAVDLRCNE